MRTDEAKSDQTQNETPQTIINDILVFQDPLILRQHVHEMMIAFLMFHESFNELHKQQVYTTYCLWQEVLEKIENFKNNSHE